MLNKNDFPKFNPDAYTAITLNRLVVYSIYYLHNNDVEITSEDIISACFILFPKKFSLKKYPRWPDSGMVSRHWSDCRRKGYIAAKTNTGRFKLTAKGSRLAEKVAKALGVAIPKKIKPSQPKKTVGILVKKAGTAPAKKVLPAPVVEAPKIKQEKKAKVHPAKQKRVASVKKVLPAPVIETPKVKQEPKEKAIPSIPVAKVRLAKQKRIPPAKKVLPAPVTKAPKVKQEQKEKAVPSIPVAKAHPAKQKRTAPAKKVSSVPVIEALKVKHEKVTQPAISVVVTQEAKVRAGKFVRLMETSDAYVHYKKHGANSNFGEFDFRSLLLCTMESSPETLARNVELFKGYAGIHNRQDLITFLTFCKDKFSYLFMPQKKAIRRTK